MGDSEDTSVGRLRGPRHTVIDEGPREPREVCAVSLVFQPGEGGGTGDVLRGSQGSPRDTAWAEGSAAALGVVPVGIPRSDVSEALSQQVAQRVGDRGAMALSMESRRTARGQPHLTVDTSQEKRTTVRRHGSTLAIRTHGLAGDRRKTPLFGARREPKHTSCDLYGIDCTRLLFYQRLTRGLSFFTKNSGLDCARRITRTERVGLR